MSPQEWRSARPRREADLLAAVRTRPYPEATEEERAEADRVIDDYENARDLDEVEL